MLLSEIDPVQNKAVDAAVNTAGFQRDDGVVGTARQAAAIRLRRTTNTCYPPAVNYTPLYYLINGVAFDKSKRSALRCSPYRVRQRGVTGNVLVRLVNAGLRMHVPSIVGSQTGLQAAAGLRADRRRRQSAARRSPRAERSLHGCGQDLRRDDQCARRGGDCSSDLRPRVEPVGQRDRARRRHAGLHQRQWRRAAQRAVLSELRSANPDTYTSVIPGQTLTVSDPAKGVIANDVNVYGVKVARGGHRRDAYPEHERHVHLCSHWQRPTDLHLLRQRRDGRVLRLARR